MKLLKFLFQFRTVRIWGYRNFFAAAHTAGAKLPRSNPAHLPEIYCALKFTLRWLLCPWAGWQNASDKCRLLRGHMVEQTVQRIGKL